MLDLSVIILTYNEEKHIARCIDNVKRIAKQIYVVDSYSTDSTCDIAREHGAIVLQNKYVNQAQQFIWAMENCPIKTEWTMRLDADEYLTDELIVELKGKLSLLPIDVTGCMLPLMVKFLGRPLKYGKIRKIQILRLWRTGKAMMEQRWMDERCYVIEGKVVAMNNYFIDENLNGIHAWTQKHNNYANREIVAAYEMGWKLVIKRKVNIISCQSFCVHSSIFLSVTSVLGDSLMVSLALFGLRYKLIGIGI